MSKEPKYVKLSDVVSRFLKNDSMRSPDYFKAYAKFSKSNDNVIITEDIDCEIATPKQITNGEN